MKLLATDDFSLRKRILEIRSPQEQAKNTCGLTGQNKFSLKLKLSEVSKVDKAVSTYRFAWVDIMTRHLLVQTQATLSIDKHNWPW